jgi:hypothetical protein
MITHWRTLGGAIVVAAAVLTLSSPALAQCPIGTDTPTECVLSSAVQTSGTLVFGKTLHITGSGKIEIVPEATGLNLDIAGDLKMDAGAVIDGNVSGAAKGATVVVNAAGDINLAGGSPGAIITSSQNPAPQSPGSCTPAGGGGDISLLAGGNVTMGNGSEVTSTSPCGRGHITITGIILNLDGLVLSEGRTTKGRGGPIDIKASCDLIVSATGEIVSKGKDPGADRVHLEGGCTVRIFGLVASTGPGHSVTTDNKCQGIERPDKPAASRACVEIWSGDTVLIDSTPPNTGEVHADTGMSGGVSGIGWVDIFAVNDITIVGNSAVPFSVHANQTLSGGHGGLVTVKSKLGSVITSGLAMQASDTTGGGQGGVITVHAGLNVEFGTATIQAKGANTGGGKQQGGTIEAFSFNGIVSGVAPGRLDADGGNGQAVPKLGLVTLRGCGTAGSNTDGVNYTGTIIPLSAPLADQCGGEPSFQTYVVFPPCACACVCVSSSSSVVAPGGAATTTIRGTGLKQVTDVYINSDTCDPGLGGTHVPKSSFLLQTDTLIRVPGSLVSGTKIVTVGPNGSCCMTAP